MKALILAAGRGTRIRSAHGDHPKCLITIDENKRTLLDQQIQSLFLHGIREVGVAVGYERQQIVGHIARRYAGCLNRFTFIDNGRFAETNNIYSLWLSRKWLRRDSFICLNADVAFDPNILTASLASTLPITMIVDRSWRDETMKVTIDGARITRMSKDISERDFGATYIGITVFQQSIMRCFVNKIDGLIRSGKTNVFFNAGVQELVDDGVQVGYVETAGLPWAEIDDPADLAFARLHVFPKLSQLAFAA